MTLLEGIRSKLRTVQEPPGPRTWGGARLLPGLHRPLDEFRPVLALTVIDRTLARPRILVGVRDPETNRTHQNVASVPTRRVRYTVARSWLPAMRGRRRLSVAQHGDIRDEVAHMLSLKLGLAEAQERNHVRFDLHSCHGFQGVSVIGEYPDGRPLTENLTMFNAIITLHNGQNLVPPATASYRPLVWADTDDFVAMTRSRDPGRLNAGLDDAFSCAYGLCLETSVAMLGLDHESPR
jgi:hypothetical protein